MRATNEIVVMSASGPVTGRPNTFVRTHRIDINNFANVVDEDFWSSAGGVVYPSGSGNTRGHAGGAFLWNDTTVQHPRCSVWLADDIWGSFSSATALTTAYQSTAGPFGNSSGDYLETREHPTYKNSFTTTCFGYTNTSGSGVRNRLVWHGRARDFPSSVRGITDLEPPMGELPRLALPAEFLAEAVAELLPMSSPFDRLLRSSWQGGER
jgi:hypothetical protein